MPGEGPGGIIIGIVGAFIGGLVFNAFGHVGVYGLNLYNILVALVGAAVLLSHPARSLWASRSRT